MSIETIEKTILQVRSVIGEWDALGATKWWEPHTRYAIVDPVLRALAWDTADPKQCHPEFPRTRTSTEKTEKVDYVLFANSSAEEIYHGFKLPDIIIETKALREPLEGGNISIERLHAVRTTYG